MKLNDVLIDELLKGAKTPEDFLVKNGLLKQTKGDLEVTIPS